FPLKQQIIFLSFFLSPQFLLSFFYVNSPNQKGSQGSADTNDRNPPLSLPFRFLFLLLFFTSKDHGRIDPGGKGKLFSVLLTVFILIKKDHLPFCITVLLFPGFIRIKRSHKSI